MISFASLVVLILSQKKK
ncbi:hypothetical protein ACI48J_01225 [Paenibacillus chitinolyticus]